MNTYPIAEEINKLLDNFAGLKMRYLGQEPYKGDCWKIFIEAPADITADELMDSVKALFDPQSTRNELKLALLEDLHKMWFEWSYARKKLQVS